MSVATAATGRSSWCPTTRPSTRRRSGTSRRRIGTVRTEDCGAHAGVADGDPRVPRPGRSVPRGTSGVTKGGAFVVRRRATVSRAIRYGASAGVQALRLGDRGSSPKRPRDCRGGGGAARGYLAPRMICRRTGRGLEALCETQRGWDTRPGASNGSNIHLGPTRRGAARGSGCRCGGRAACVRARRVRGSNGRIRSGIVGEADSGCGSRGLRCVRARAERARTDARSGCGGVGPRDRPQRSESGAARRGWRASIGSRGRSSALWTLAVSRAPWRRSTRNTRGSHAVEALLRAGLGSSASRRGRRRTGGARGPRVAAGRADQSDGPPRAQKRSRGSSFSRRSRSAARAPRASARVRRGSRIRAGFPGLPLADPRGPTCRVLAVESRERRHHFQRSAIRALEIANARADPGRAEQLEPGSLQVVVAQAMAQARAGARLDAPLGGSAAWLAMSVQRSAASIEPPPASSLAGLRRYRVPGGGPSRCLWLGPARSSLDGRKAPCDT